MLLVGPRYSGHVKVPPSCREPIALRATPRPTTVEFHGLPPNSVLSCERCPGIRADANYLPKHLPPMVMRGLRTSVSLWVRAPGFHSVEFTVVLYPGNNVVRIPMRPRSASR